MISTYHARVGAAAVGIALLAVVASAAAQGNERTGTAAATRTGAEGGPSNAIPLRPTTVRCSTTGTSRSCHAYLFTRLVDGFSPTIEYAPAAVRGQAAASGQTGGIIAQLCDADMLLVRLDVACLPDATTTPGLTPFQELPVRSEAKERVNSRISVAPELACYKVQWLVEDSRRKLRTLFGQSDAFEVRRAQPLVPSESLPRGCR